VQYDQKKRGKEVEDNQVHMGRKHRSMEGHEKSAGNRKLWLEFQLIGLFTAIE